MGRPCAELGVIVHAKQMMWQHIHRAEAMLGLHSSLTSLASSNLKAGASTTHTLFFRTTPRV